MPAGLSSRLRETILTTALLLSLAFCTIIGLQNRRLANTPVQRGPVTLSGPAEAVQGDLVPEFRTSDAGGATVEVAYGVSETARLLLVGSERCQASSRQRTEWWPQIREMTVDTSVQPLALSLDDSLPNSSEATIPEAFFRDLALQRAYRVTAIPMTMLVSPDGEVRWVRYGIFDEEALASLRVATREEPSTADTRSSSNLRARATERRPS